MKEILQKLYPEEYEYALEAVSRLIEEFKEKNNSSLGHNLGREFTEKDILLLCYADHVCEPGIKSLITLKKFLDEFCKDFSIFHILPFYPSSGDGGFSVIDYYKVGEAYGNWDDINNLTKNHKVMFDLVLNHVSDESEWFQKYLEGDKFYEKFFISFDEEKELPEVFRPRPGSALKPYETSKGRKYVWSTFPHQQVDLNYRNPYVMIEIVKVLLYYVNRGAKLIRLDAVAYLWKKLGTSCFDLVEAHSFVKLLRIILNEVSPDVKIIAETVLQQEKNIAYLKSGSDLVYNFPLEGLLYHAFFKGEAKKLMDFVESLGPGMLNLCVSHDGIHVGPIRGLVPDEDIKQLGEYCLAKGCKHIVSKDTYEFNVSFIDAAGSTEAYIASLAILLSLKGVPLIYLNNLLGERSWIEGVKTTGFARAANRKKFEYDFIKTELFDVNNEKYKIYSTSMELIRKRKNEPLFSPKTEQKVVEFDERIFSIIRQDEDAKILVLVNVTKDDLELDYNKLRSIFGKNSATDIISGREMIFDKSFSLSSYEILWLK